MSARFLLVCEGPTDITIIKGISAEISRRESKTIEIQDLSPQLDATSRTYPSHGWTEVRNWCKKNGSVVPATAPAEVRAFAHRNNWQALLAISKADGIIIQLDTDIAEEINGAAAFVSSMLDRRAYCQAKVLEWLGLITPPPRIYLALATHSTENWILALHDRVEPAFSDLPAGFNFEDISDPVLRLISLGYKTNKWGKLVKNPAAYSSYAKKLVGDLDRARTECSELNALCQHFEQA